MMHECRLNTILHLILDTHHHQITGQLYHHHTDSGTDQECCHRQYLRGIARGNHLVEYQFRNVWRKHGEQYHAYTSSERIDGIGHTKIVKGVTHNARWRESTVREGATGYKRLAFQHRIALATVYLILLSAFGMNKTIRCKARPEYHRGVVCLQKSNHGARTAFPPTV